MDVEAMRWTILYSFMLSLMLSSHDTLLVGSHACPQLVYNKVASYNTMFVSLQKPSEGTTGRGAIETVMKQWFRTAFGQNQARALGYVHH